MRPLRNIEIPLPRIPKKIAFFAVKAKKTCNRQKKPQNWQRIRQKIVTLHTILYLHDYVRTETNKDCPYFRIPQGWT